MLVDVEIVPIEIISKLKRVNSSLAGRCFENCVLAVVGLPAELGLEYVLGFMTPPGYKTEARAWLRQIGATMPGPTYFDPTLQDPRRFGRRAARTLSMTRDFG